MADRDADLEFLPTEEDEDDQLGAEDEAVHARLPDEVWEATLDEGGEVDADELTDDELDAEALAEGERGPGDEAGVAGAVEGEPGRAGAGGDAGAPGPDEDGEVDLQEVVRRHYGLVSEEPDEDLGRPGDELRAPGADEFVCASCLLRRPMSQMADPATRTCVDCRAGRA
ncbi:MAG TPA: hypothetical protein VFI47_10840 [Acidimicrobiales bacterium]|nr:hypothetical protein [Acidimicrobiales bacterium]